MSGIWNPRIPAIATLATSLASCSTSDVDVVGLDPQSLTSVSASAISVTYLPEPAGVAVQGFSPSLSAGGFIFSISATSPSQPYVWTSPYTAAPAQIADAGSIGGDEGNDTGDIRGSLNGPGFWAHVGTQWQFTPVNVGSYTSVSVRSVNNARSLAGYGSINGAQRALWWADASAQPVELPLPPLAGTCTGAQATALNNVGDVVGDVREQIVVGRKTQTRVHAVIWKASLGWQPILLEDVGTQNTAYDVNDAGQVAGNASVSTAVLWSPTNGVYGSATIVSTSQGALTHLDRCGRVVGYTQTSTPNKRRGWLWENGVLTTLPLPAGAVASLATQITTDLTTGEGMIVGGAIPSGGGNNNSAFRPVRWTLLGCP